MSRWKAKVVTALFVILLIVLAWNVVTMVPALLPWILGAFAVPGVIKFGRVLFVWLTTESEPLKFPKWDGKKKRFVEGDS